LQNHNVHVYPSPTAHTHKKNDSFAEAFPHFDSKVLSTARTRGHGTNVSYFDSDYVDASVFQSLWIWAALMSWLIVG
jgi:hypothetical protein